MRRRTGKEMRKLMVALSASTLILVLAIIAYFMVDVILTTNKNIERNKELVIEQSVLALTEIGESISGMAEDPRLTSMFNQELINEIMSGNWDVFYDFIGDFASRFYPVEYVGVIRDGELVSFKTARGYDLEAGEIPAQTPQEDYQVLEKLGDKEGFFISVFCPIDLSLVGLGEFQVNMINDRTDELAEVEGYFKDQRNDLIVRLSIASIIAIILSLLITTLGLRYFTRKYVVRPIEKLNRAAERIADGTYEGEVEVDEDSAYAALQGLLRSGQKVLQRMDEELRE